MDWAHDGAFLYVAYLLTGDPYYLEGLQYQAISNIGQYKRTTAYLTPFAGQTRGFAWALRTIGHAAHATPSSALPSWVLPKSEFEEILDQCHTWFEERYTNNLVSPATAYFHVATNVSAVAGWQDCFLTGTIAGLVEHGFSDWQNDYAWKVQSVMARSDGVSGWPRQFPCPYYYAMGVGVPSGYDPNVTPAGGWHANYAAAWAAYKANPANAIHFLNGNPSAFPTNATSWQQANSPEYLAIQRNELARAARHGVVGAAAAHTFCKSMLTLKNYGDHRWSVAAP